jgi:hypothetical protein
MQKAQKMKRLRLNCGSSNRGKGKNEVISALLYHGNFRLLEYLLSIYLVLWIRALTEKMITAQRIKKFPALYESLKCIKIFKEAATGYYPDIFKFSLRFQHHFTLWSTASMLSLQSGLSFRFPTKILYPLLTFLKFSSSALYPPGRFLVLISVRG